jgi:hypothetical protein
MGSHLKMTYTREQNFVRTQAKPLKPKPRSHQGHFDPEELSRRLYLVLADQKAHAERKRARAEEAKLKDHRSGTIRHHNKEGSGRRSKEAGREAVPATEPSSSKNQTSVKPAGSTSSGELRRQKSSKSAPQRKESKANLSKDAPKSAPEPPTTYHHVPQEAAKQFARTTTVEGMRDGSGSLSHKLSKQALKLHLAAGAAAHSLSHRAGEGSALERSRSTRKDDKDREKVYERAHQRTRILEETAEVEEEGEEYHVAPQYQKLQHTFQAELTRMKSAEHHLDIPTYSHRRNSTGDILAKAEDTRRSMVLVERTSLADVLEASTPPPDPDPATADEHRVDWTQSDEQEASAAAAAAAAAASPPAQRHKPLLSPLLRKADSIWTLRGRLGSGSKGSASMAAQEKSDVPPVPESPKAGFFSKFKR